MRPLEALEAIIAGRRVAIVGNAASALERVNAVDENDVVVRLNEGYKVAPGHRAALGERTDILMVSGFRGEAILRAASHVVWMTPKSRDELTPAEVAALYFYPIAWWEDLVARLGTRPSTGCMAIDLVARMVGGGAIALYGFDFWRSDNWYTHANRPEPHSPGAEEALIRALPAVVSIE